MFQLKLLFRLPSSLRPKRPIVRPVESEPILSTMWKEIRAKYFPDRPDIDEYSIVWSTRRQKRTLASCNVRTKKVNVARELANPKLQEWLDPLLYHEMCHAIIGIPGANARGRRQIHGREFRSLERKHPRIRDLDHWIKTGGWLSAVRSDRARRRTR